MNIAAITRLVAYSAAIGLGIFMAVWGVVHEDAALTTTGIALATTGGIAAPNTPVRSTAAHAAD